MNIFSVFHETSDEFSYTVLISFMYDIWIVSFFLFGQELCLESSLQSVGKFIFFEMISSVGSL